MMESQRLVLFVRPAREKGAFVLGLSDPEERFTVGHALYHELGEVRGGDALSSESVAMIKTEDESRRARKAALSLLSYADNSRRRLFEKLRRKGISAEIAERTVSDMIGEGLLSEERQLESAVLSLAEHRLFGPYRILADLSSKGYRGEDIRAAIHAAMEQGNIDFNKNLARLFEKKLGENATEEEKRKLKFTYGYKR
jgi:SOS response regulatory protein OraA/RecX